FFFSSRRRHTRSKRDWSSDVCSSDLLGFASQTSASNLISGLFLIGEGSFEIGDTVQMTLIRGHTIEGEVISIDLLSVKLLTQDKIGRASCRERVEIVVRVG